MRFVHGTIEQTLGCWKISEQTQGGCVRDAPSSQECASPLCASGILEQRPPRSSSRVMITGYYRAFAHRASVSHGPGGREGTGPARYLSELDWGECVPARSQRPGARPPDSASGIMDQWPSMLALTHNNTRGGPYFLKDRKSNIK